MQNTSRTKIIRFASIFSALSLAMVACTGAFDDPFVSPKQGTIAGSQTVNLANTNPQKITLFRVGHTSDTIVVDNGVTRLREGQKASWSELEVTDKDGKVLIRSFSEILQAAKCADTAPDIRELLELYPSFIPICDNLLVEKLQSAASIVVKTADGRTNHFTSWGVTLRSIGLTDALIYSVSL